MRKYECTVNEYKYLSSLPNKNMQTVINTKGQSLLALIVLQFANKCLARSMNCF